MITIYQIRGTNGSGKTHLARSLIADDPRYGQPNMVDLTWYSSPTKADPLRRKAVEGYAMPHRFPGVDVLLVGSYRTACGGLDGVPDFETQFSALRGAGRICADMGRAEHQAIICEGVLASTVYGSWGDFASMVKQYSDKEARFAFCYLDTPLEVCLQRIRGRQEAAGKVRPIKEDLVADKIKAISATRRRAMEAGHTVYDLPWDNPGIAFRSILTDYTLDLVTDNGTSRVSSREYYRARL